MGSYICKLEGKYFEYSTTVDAPVTDPMTLEELTELVREKEGSLGLSELPRRLDRVDERGTSSLMDPSVESVLFQNRAGKNESVVSMETLKSWARGEITNLREVSGYVFPDEDDGKSGWDWFILGESK